MTFYLFVEFFVLYVVGATSSEGILVVEKFVDAGISVDSTL